MTEFLFGVNSWLSTRWVHCLSVLTKIKLPSNSLTSSHPPFCSSNTLRVRPISSAQAVKLQSETNLLGRASTITQTGYPQPSGSLGSKFTLCSHRLTASVNLEVDTLMLRPQYELIPLSLPQLQITKKSSASPKRIPSLLSSTSSVAPEAKSLLLLLHLHLLNF